MMFKHVRRCMHHEGVQIRTSSPRVLRSETLTRRRDANGAHHQRTWKRKTTESIRSRPGCTVVAALRLSLASCNRWPFGSAHPGCDAQCAALYPTDGTLDVHHWQNNDTYVRESLHRWLWIDHCHTKNLRLQQNSIRIRSQTNVHRLSVSKRAKMFMSVLSVTHQQGSPYDDALHVTVHANDDALKQSEYKPKPSRSRSSSSSSSGSSSSLQ